MFTPGSRQALRDELVERARDDPSVVGAALVGSAATGREDRWSDIDLALQLRPGADQQQVAEGWTTWLRTTRAVADTLDIVSGSTLFRVFLLADSLQVDLSFWPHDDFRATEPGFAVLFGDARDATAPRPTDVSALVGTAWLYALHARSASARGKVWQTAIMLDGLRDQLIALACLRHGLDPSHGRDADRLPDDELAVLGAARATSVDADELRRSKRELLDALRTEVGRHDHDLALRLSPVLELLAEE